jgi:hypothetical protein
MRKLSTTLLLILTGLFIIAGLTSCYKNDIQFGNELTDSYTRIITVDTVTPVMSTVVLDSFITSGSTTLMAGRYTDQLMGNVEAKTFIQFSHPDTTTIADDAVYDSLIVVIPSAGYHYGDSTGYQTFSVYELKDDITYSYASYLYNTSDVARKPFPLGSITTKYSSASGDSLQIRLDDEKGQLFFALLKQQDDRIRYETNFLDYFKGVCLQVNSTDSASVCAFDGSAGKVKMRLYYHTPNPFPVAHAVTFSNNSVSYQFNQIKADRSKSLLKDIPSGETDITSSSLHDYGFTQSGTGVLLKLTFPSLRNLLQLSSVVQLLDAQIVIKPVSGTYDVAKLRLPSNLYMAYTGPTNTVGSFLATNGVNITASLYSDEIYGANTQYLFSVYNDINTLFKNVGVTQNGFFVLEENPALVTKLDRVVFGSSDNTTYKAKLILKLLTVK